MEKFLTKDFWESFALSLKDWIITELPSILILFVLLIITLSLVTYMVNKLKKKYGIAFWIANFFGKLRRVEYTALKIRFEAE